MPAGALGSSFSFWQGLQLACCESFIFFSRASLLASFQRGPPIISSQAKLTFPFLVMLPSYGSVSLLKNLFLDPPTTFLLPGDCLPMQHMLILYKTCQEVPAHGEKVPSSLPLAAPLSCGWRKVGYGPGRTHGCLGAGLLPDVVGLLRRRQNPWIRRPGSEEMLF